MTELRFKRTIKDCNAFFSVCYTEPDGDDIEDLVLLENNEGRCALPDGINLFVLKCTMQGTVGGSVELEIKVGSRTLKPEFKRTLKAGERGTIVIYQARSL